MNEKARSQAATRHGGRMGEVEPLRRSGKLFLGIDIGSTSSDVALVDEGGGSLYLDYRRTQGRPIETIRSQLGELFGRIEPADIVFSAATGSVGRFLAELVNIPFVNEVAAQAAAVSHLYPHFKQATIIEMGGQDSKLIFLSSEDGVCRVRDFALNTVCAAGTGSFLDQQAQRLGISIEEQFGQMAIESTSVPRMAGRCSVFAKSDMIHLQQQATPTSDIIAGLCLALARNLKSNLGCGREFVKPIVFTGGVAANIGVVRALEEVFDLAEGELVVPKEHFFTGAMGAVLVARGRAEFKETGRMSLSDIDEYLSKRGSALHGAPRREPLERPSMLAPESRVYGELLPNNGQRIDAYLGVDVGSISTNVVVMDEQKRVLAKAYLMTAGRPLEAVRQGMEMVGREVAGKVRILGAATTGSGRYLTGDFIGADVVINEITAQAAGAAIVNPKVDTIFEIGGQDSKYISLENGVVVDFEMNHACAAGTGSFLEEQAQRLGISIDKEFAELAFRSPSPIKLGERCTVFMESDLLSYQQQGAQTSDLVAGLAYSIVANYLNRVVGRRKIGNNICFQGGTAFNEAVWAAFEKVTGKPIMVPDHHEVTGALGAASIAAEHMKAVRGDDGQEIESGFRGFENMVTLEYSVESFRCEHCSNDCEIKKVLLPGSEPLYYGSRCDRYNLKKKRNRIKGAAAFEFRRRKMLELAGAGQENSEGGENKKVRIGIPLALANLQLLPLFGCFFRSLGFEVVLSEETNKRTIRKGVETVPAQTCFPVKVGYGHIADLIEKEVDYIFLPSIVSMTSGFQENDTHQLCPYVQSFAYQVQATFGDRPGKTRILSVPLRMGETEKVLQKGFRELGRQLGVSAAELKRAMEEAFGAQRQFDRCLRERGREILDNLPADKKLFVLVSRPYNGCDDGLNLQLPKKLAELGAEVMPMDMLDLAEAPLGDAEFHKKVYWNYGQKILRAAEIIKRDKRLFAIYLSNFSCGPDSFLLTFFKDIMEQKPCLQLEIDEHSADAGVITRLEAFLESLKHYRAGAKKEKNEGLMKAADGKRGGKRKLYVPYMSDCSYGVAACFKAHGQPAEVMPLANEETLMQGRRFTSGKECLPCAITTGDMLNVLNSRSPEECAFFMPGGKGPCRFGMYNCLHSLILKYAGREGAALISPNQNGRFYQEFSDIADVSEWNGFLKDVWISTGGLDLLNKVRLRLRPYARSREHIEDVYEGALRRWVKAVEERRGMNAFVQLMGSIAADFAGVEMDRSAAKPRIGIVGEIYVRNHPFANKNIVDRLEALGAVCEMASLAEWIYYTNFTRDAKARRLGHIRNMLVNKVQNYYQRKIEKRLAAPLERYFGPVAEGPIEDVIRAGARYLHESFEGEAILSVGKMVEFHHGGVGGVVNVMPFSCMPSTIVSTQTMRVSADCGGMPILNLSFDGQEDPTLTTRLEAFVEQVKQRQSAKATISEITV